MRALGKLHAQVHAIQTPTERSWQIYSIARSAAVLKPYVPEETVEAVKRLVNSSEDGFCHADLSLTNVLWDKGNLTVLDWARSGQGPMTADVGRTCAFILARPPRMRLLRPLNRWFSRRLAKAYVAAYAAETGRSLEEIRAWTAVFLARKLAQPLSQPRSALIRREIVRLCRNLG
jgi:Ser/Thr protein kinase RdoA (MazF antagonist)